MSDQDSPWKDLPPAPPGVPDQSPKPIGRPEHPGTDPWKRSAHREPPGTTEAPGSRPGGIRPGSPSGFRKIVLIAIAFIVFQTFGRLCVDGVIRGERPPSRDGMRVDGLEPPPARPFRLLRSGSDSELPQGWGHWTASDGSFDVVGPGRPLQRVDVRSAVYVFATSGREFVVEVDAGRIARSELRTILDRSTEIVLDDLGAVEEMRRWGGAGARAFLEMEASRPDTSYRMLAVYRDRRLLVAYGTWHGRLDAGIEVDLDVFLDGIRPREGG